MTQPGQPSKIPQLQPGSLLAILGGGQLGRMMAIAARTMGYRVRVLDPDPNCPASFVVDEVIVGDWRNADAARRLATGADAVTLEIEQIDIAALQTVADLAPLRPGVEPIRIIQDKTLQKSWLRDHGFPVGDFEIVHSASALAAALPKLGGKVFLKIARGGYDGRGQARLGFQTPASPDEITAAWQSIGSPSAATKTAVAEAAQDLALEISVMAARNPNGEVRAYPASRNHHENQILAWSVTPASVSDQLESRAETIAAEIVAALGIEGLLCVEFFVTTSGQLLVNELAPRPHNSYHQSERANATSQFEQAVRAALNLPLGDTTLVQPTAIINLLGDLWLNPSNPAAPNRQPNFAAALTIPGVRLHLYEKHTPRPARKMGHLSAIGQSPDEAVARVKAAYEQLL